MRAIGINQFLDRSFVTFEFTGQWKEHLGEPERNFVMLVHGMSGNGKTDYCVKLAKYLGSFTSVDYFSYEEGISKTLQDAIKRNELQEVSGQIMFIEKCSMPEMIERLEKPRSAQVVIIDSLDYMNLTTEQFKRLRKLFPRKSFIVICWERSGEPKSQYAKDIKYMADIKVRVYNFKAHAVTRFGGFMPFTIWDRKKAVGEQLNMF
jgi:archaellum biogenesis ATPase FlaH